MSPSNDAHQQCFGGDGHSETVVRQAHHERVWQAHYERVERFRRKNGPCGTGQEKGPSRAPFRIDRDYLLARWLPRMGLRADNAIAIR